MYCGNCGSNIPEGADFCPKCGEPAANPRAQHSARNRQAYYRQCVWKRRWRRIRLLITMLVVIVGLLAAAQWGYWWWNNFQAGREPEPVLGRGSYTTLVTDYLAAAEAQDLETISSLFFPGSEDFYQNADGDRPLAQILVQEDKWASNYGKTVSDLTLGTAQFADLSGEKAAGVAQTIQAYSGLESINELYSVQGTVTYSDGSAVRMVFEVVQCELGCFLVNIEGSAA